MNTVRIEHVECVRETPLALLVVIDGVERWVPKSQVHDDSEVYVLGDVGALVLTEWFAEKEGLT